MGRRHRRAGRSGGEDGEDGEAAGLSNHYILKLARRFARNDFAGTFSSDNLPQKLCHRRRFSLVCNLDKETGPGTHFVSIVADADQIAYIDPLGLPCGDARIARFLRDSGRSAAHNERTIQHPLSPFCGFYALLYVLFFDSSIRHRLKLKFDRTALESNDELCVRYLVKLMRAAAK
jgi:hypothetical protein